MEMIFFFTIVSLLDTEGFAEWFLHVKYFLYLYKPGSKYQNAGQIFLYVTVILTDKNI